MHVDISWRIMGSPGRSSPERSVRSRSAEGRRDDLVLHEVALELVPRASVERWIPFAEKPENPFAVFDRGVRLGRHDHAIRDFCRAGWNQFGLAFDRDETDPTVADGGEFGYQQRVGISMPDARQRRESFDLQERLAIAHRSEASACPDK